MSAVLVTGGAGYIGSHVCKALAESGLTPICYDTLEKGHRWAVQWGPLEQGDIGDAQSLDKTFARHKPNAIVHLAGYSEGGDTVCDPERDLYNNAAKPPG
jgi:UDP-glucose 4-epimerase